jgi:putative phosphoserine phosphatase/1-acylglycerol-3-phosphate O-acyltransferase
MRLKRQKRTRAGSQTAAFFDFDNTLIRGDSQGLEIEHLFRHRRLPLKTLIPIVTADFLFKRNLIRADQIVKICLRIYRGRTADQLATWVPALYAAEIRPRLSAAICSLVRTHRRAGHLPVILSASLGHLIEPVASELGIRHVVCTRLETNSRGLFTGRTDGPVCVGRHKAAQAIRLAEHQGIDLAASYVYTDHHADLPLLQAVGHPVAVSPTRRLRRTAEQQNWVMIAN